MFHPLKWLIQFLSLKMSLSASIKKKEQDSGHTLWHNTGLHLFLFHLKSPSGSSANHQNQKELSWHLNSLNTVHALTRNSVKT